MNNQTESFLLAFENDSQLINKFGKLSKKSFVNEMKQQLLNKTAKFCPFFKTIATNAIYNVDLELVWKTFKQDQERQKEEKILNERRRNESNT